MSRVLCTSCSGVFIAVVFRRLSRKKELKCPYCGVVGKRETFKIVPYQCVDCGKEIGGRWARCRECSNKHSDIMYATHKDAMGLRMA